MCETYITIVFGITDILWELGLRVLFSLISDHYQFVANGDSCDCAFTSLNGCGNKDVSIYDFLLTYRTANYCGMSWIGVNTIVLLKIYNQ